MPLRKSCFVCGINATNQQKKLISDDNSDIMRMELQTSVWRASPNDLLFNIFCTKDNIYNILTPLNLFIFLKAVFLFSVL